MTLEYPSIGAWYRHPDGSLYEVVAVDEADNTIELQHFDGTLEEMDAESWPGLLVETGAPEDWSGAVDMDPEDYAGNDGEQFPYGWHDPMEFLDRMD